MVGVGVEVRREAGMRREELGESLAGLLQAGWVVSRGRKTEIKDSEGGPGSRTKSNELR